MNNCAVVLAILQKNRVETAVKVQDVLTKYGCYIRVRLGLHDAGLETCTNSGIMILQLCGDEIPLQAMQDELLAIPDVKIKSMVLDF